MVGALQLLLDQGLPADAAPLFRTLGYVCHHVSEFAMQRTEDQAILLKAVAESFVVVTLDADFRALVSVRRMSGPSVIRIRKEGYRADQLVLLLRGVLVKYHSELLSGCLISVSDLKGDLPVASHWLARMSRDVGHDMPYSAIVG